jgi:hypothetical protein
MNKQVAAIVLAAVFVLGAATASFAQGNGNAIGGGASGGPGAKNPEPTAGGSMGNNTSEMHMKQKQHAKHLKKLQTKK